MRLEDRHLGGRQFPVFREEGAGIHKKRTISQSLPMSWPEETALRSQVVRLIVQAAVKKRTGKFCGREVAHRLPRESLNPCQPSRIFYL